MPNRIAPELNCSYLIAHDWWANVSVAGPDDCWPWLRSFGSHGYGQTWDGVTVRLAHRVAWTLTNGPIPPGLTVDHNLDLCLAGKICCNPAHLRLLDNATNATDNRQGRKQTCPANHPYNDDNTYIDRRGHRRCRACAKNRRQR